MNNITIEQMSAADIKEVIALGLATTELHVGTGEPEYYTEKMLRSFITSRHDIHLVAKSGNTLAGYFTGSYNPYLKEAYLIDLVVKPEFRGQGVASLLIDQAFNHLHKQEGFVWAWCLVHQDNEKMMAILEKKGFHHGRNFTMFYRG